MKKVHLLQIVAIVCFMLLARQWSAASAQPQRPDLLQAEPIPPWPGSVSDEPTLTPPVSEAPATPANLGAWSKIVYQIYRNQTWNVRYGSGFGYGESTRVTDNGVYPSLHPDNVRVAFSRFANGSFDIYVIHTDGTNRRLLTDTGGDEVRPHWSPDGANILFQSYRDGQSELYTMTENGYRETNLTEHPAYDGMPSWSPDGSRVAFVSDRSGIPNIYVMNANGSQVTHLATAGPAIYPAWSPDGEKIAFNADMDDNGWWDVWLMDADGSDQIELYNVGQNTDLLVSSWRPDGQFVIATEVSYIFYEGNWYWTEANPRGVHLDQKPYLYNYIGYGLEWYPHWQNLDREPPQLSVTPPPVVSTNHIQLDWSAVDSGGSGLKNYDVQVQLNDGGWQDLMVATTETSGSYQATGGDVVAFRVRARDNAFNTTPWWGPVVTTVDSEPPQLYLNPLPRFQQTGEPLVLSWGAYDPGQSGIDHYEVEYRLAGLNWVSWGNTTETYAHFTSGLAGKTYEFRVRGMDKAQNLSAWHTLTGEQATRFYHFGITGNVHDNTGTPLPGVTAVTGYTPWYASNLPAGQFGVYFPTIASSYQVGWQRDHYLPLPATQFTAGPDQGIELRLPPLDNLVANWGFEAGADNADWHVAGPAAVITAEQSHSGRSGALLGQEDWMSDLGAPPYPNWQPLWFDVDDDHTIHVADILNYYTVTLDQQWSDPYPLAVAEGDYEPTSRRNLMTESGVVHIFGNQSMDGTWALWHQIRDAAGSWGAAQPILSISGSNYDVVTGPGETLHLLFNQDGLQYPSNEIWYAEFDGTDWAEPVMISQETDDSKTVHKIVVTDDGTVHALWSYRWPEHLFYRMRTPDGVWHAIHDVTGDVTAMGRMLDMAVDPAGGVHLVYRNSVYTNDGPAEIYYQHLTNGAWGAPVQINTNEDMNQIALAVTSTGQPHIAWLNDTNIYYVTQTAPGVWSSPRSLRQTSQPTGYIHINHYGVQMSVDGQDVVHIDWSEVTDSPDPNYWIWTIQYAQVTPTRQIKVSRLHEGPAFSGNRTWCLLLAEDTGLYWFAPNGYRFPQSSDLAGRHTIQTAVTLPVTMTMPVLSYAYDVGGLSQAESFAVTVDDGAGQTVLTTTSAATGGWRYTDHDLSPWVGETISLTFSLESESASLASVYLDEITVGSTYPDLSVAVADGLVLPGNQLVQTVRVSNRGGAVAENAILTYTLPADLTFVAASLPPQSTNPLVWVLGDVAAKQGVEPLVITLTAAAETAVPTLETMVDVTTTAVEYELGNNQANSTIRIGADLYLPLLLRQP